LEKVHPLSHSLRPDKALYFRGVASQIPMVRNFIGNVRRENLKFHNFVIVILSFLLEM
jgi:hypothetical protein